MRRRKLLLGAAALGAAGAIGGVHAARPHLVTAVDRSLNRVALDPAAPEPDAADRRLHGGMFIADLHADTLKWDRDLLELSGHGHADLPRLHAGNVALQVFAMVTHSPVRYPWRDCMRAESINHAAWLALLQGRPFRSARGRAFSQIDRFWSAVHRSRYRGGLTLRAILNATELEALVAARAAGETVIGGILGLEGGHWIGEYDHSVPAVRLEIQRLFDAGLRVFAPVHRFDNPLAGSSEGCARYGLTPAGRNALMMAQEHGMVIDLAHISEQGAIDAAELLSEPFIVSHTGVRATCEGPCRPERNLSDDAIRSILDSGGVIGIGFWPHAIGDGVAGIPRAMAHVMELADRRGLDPSRHVALGSDFDGSVRTQIEAEHLDVLTATLRHIGGFDDRTIARIMGRNVCRLFATRLPGGSPDTARRIEERLELNFV
jgi:membrane dipeptidase